MAINVTLQQIPAIIDWAHAQHKPIPKVSNGQISIAGVTNAELSQLVSGFVQSDLDRAQRNVILRQYQAGMGPVPKAELDQSKIYYQNINRIIASEKRKKVTGPVDQAKIAGYVDKAKIAQAVVDATASAEDIAYVQAEADARGLDETVEDLAAAQLTRAANLRTARALIDGIESRFEREIDQAANLATIEASMEAMMVEYETHGL